MNTGEILWQKTHSSTPDEIKNNPALKALDLPRLFPSQRSFSFLLPSSWVTGGSIQKTGSGAQTFSYAGAGSYQGSTASGNRTEAGTGSSAYGFSASYSLVNGTWQAVSGSGTSDESGLTQLGYSGTVTYSHPIPGGTLNGIQTESQHDGTGYRMRMDATLGADGAWTTTGATQVTAFGRAASSDSGAGHYDTGLQQPWVTTGAEVICMPPRRCRTRSRT